MAKARRLIEFLCLAPHAMQRLDGRGQRYPITLPLAANVDAGVTALLDSTMDERPPQPLATFLQ